MVDERRILRARQEEARRALGRIALPDPGSAAMLVRVYQLASLPTAKDKYFACHPVNPGGPECEGCTPTFAADAGTVFVLCVGPRVPVAGDYLIARSIGGRWVAENPRGSCNWTFTVRGACTNAVQSGSIVDLYQSAVLIASGTTNGSGVVTLNVPAGTYDVVVTPPAGSGYAVNTSSRAHTCTQSTTITLAADSDHICWPCCGVPLPKTFHSTDADGPIALTWDPTSGTTAPRYTLVTTTQVSSACVNDGFGCTDCQSPATVAKTYGLTFRTNCTVILGISTTFTCCTSGASFRIGGTTNEISTPFDGTLSCNPLMATFTIPTTFQVPSCLTPALSTPGGGGVLVFTP